MTPERNNPIPEYKTKLVEILKNLIQSKKTILFASIKNLPGGQFQEISKKIRDKAIVKVPKKSLFFRAVDETKNKELQRVKEYFDGGVAILFSDKDSYDLAADLLKNKSPAKAKAGQEAPEDIKIEAGPTDLPPGPAISELGSVGLQVMVQEGKIAIKEAKVIVKKGQIIKQNAADIMSKLGVMPFSIGFIPLSSFDTKENKFYTEIKINTEEAIDEIKDSFGRALAFAVCRGYTTSDTIKFILGKAAMNEKAIISLLEKNSGENNPQKQEIQTPEEKTEAISEETLEEGK